MIRTKLPLAFTGLLFFTLLSWHCTKIDTTTLGSGLIPAVDNVNTFDTLLNIIPNNIDSVLLGKGCTTIYPTDEHVLGYIGNDPYFGTTKATLYTEVKPPVFPFYLPGKPADRTLDSIVLVLSYRRTYGDASIQQSVEVHELNPTGAAGFVPDSNTCTVYPFKPLILGSAFYTPARLVDSVKGFKDTTNNVLRIRLSAALGQKFLTPDSSVTSAFYSDSLARDFFKGFAIIPGATGNALNYFSLSDNNTRLAVYYKVKNASGKNDTTVTNFRFNVAANSANNIVRTRGASEIVSVANKNSNPLGDNFIYVQTTPGSGAMLNIPGLSVLSNRIIHRAELIVEQATPTALDKILTPPPFLFIDLQDSANGSFHPVPCDFNTVDGQPDIGTYGGFRTVVKNAAGDSVSRYTFVISRYVQKIVTNKKPNLLLRLMAPNYVRTAAPYYDQCNLPIQQLLFALNNIAYGRIKLVGGNATSTQVNRIRLRIIYSKI